MGLTKKSVTVLEISDGNYRQEIFLKLSQETPLLKSDLTTCIALTGCRHAISRYISETFMQIEVI